MRKKAVCVMAFVLAVSGLPLTTASARDWGDIVRKALPLFLNDKYVAEVFSSSLEEEYSVVEDSEEQERIERITEKLLPYVQNKDTEYQFKILASSEFNACSVYGGRIYFNRGMLRHTANSDDELAAAAAHEISHQDLGHNNSVLKEFKLRYAGSEILQLDKKAPKFVQAVVEAVLAKRNQEHELEADQRALEIMDRAGFRLSGPIALFSRIEAMHRIEQERSKKGLVEKEFDRIFSTHPEPAARIALAEDYLLEKKYGTDFREIAGIPTADAVVKPTDTFIPSKIGGFGDNWLEKCSCNIWMLHCAVDVDLHQKGKEIKAMASGRVRYAGSFGKRWGDCVILEHNLLGVGICTTLYGHIKIAPGIEASKIVEIRTLLGTIDPKVSSPHLHFGIRLAPYDRNLSIKGALHACSSPAHQPKFPEHFVDPEKFLAEYQPPKPQSGRDEILIYQGPIHLGDDEKDTESYKEQSFNLEPEELNNHQSVLSIWVRGYPWKDPIIFINRKEVGRVVTRDNNWHKYEFQISPKILAVGQNLFSIRSFIPSLSEGMDDCDFRDVLLSLVPARGLARRNL